MCFAAQLRNPLWTEISYLSTDTLRPTLLSTNRRVFTRPDGIFHGFFPRRSVTVAARSSPRSLTLFSFLFFPSRSLPLFLFFTTPDRTYPIARRAQGGLVMPRVQKSKRIDVNGETRFQCLQCSDHFPNHTVRAHLFVSFVR